MQKKILIAGYYGFGNLGDEAILTAILTGMRSSFPVALDITVVSGNPEETEKRYQVAAVSWNNLDAIIQNIQEADLVLLGGGGLFQDYWTLDWSSFLTSQQQGIPFYASFPILAKAAGKPCLILSIGVGPLRTEEGRSLTRIAFNNADIVTVRDQQSLDLLASLRVANPSIYLSADPAFNLAPDTHEADRILKESTDQVSRDAPRIGISLRDWNLGPPSNVWQGQVADALDQFMEATGSVGFFVPFQIVGDSLTNDLIVSQNVLAQMKLASRVRLLNAMDSTPYAPEVVAGLFARCDLVIGMRLHSLILAAGVGTPVVGVSYDPKVNNLMQRLGIEECLLELDALDSASLFKVMIHAWDSRLLLKSSLKSRATDLKKEARRDFEYISDLLENGYSPKPFSDKDFMGKIVIKQTRELFRMERSEAEQSLLVEKLKAEKDEAERLLQVAQAQSAEWQRQLNMIYSSNSWKIMSVLGGMKLKIAPPGSLMDRFFKRFAQLVIATREQGLGYTVRTLISRSNRGGDETTNTFNWVSVLDSLLEQYTKTVEEIIVFLPGVEWDLPLFQRPQQMASAFARLGCLVLYCEPNYSKSAAGIHQVEERLYRCQVPLGILDRVENPVAIVFTYNRSFISYLRQPRVVYEYIDDLEVFPYDQQELKRNHADLCRSATVVAATAERLLEEVQQVRPDAILCPNGVDYHHFEPARDPDSSPPSDLVSILAHGKPVIGYYGALARWFDYELMVQVASQRPDLSFLLIGPDYDGTLPNSGLLDHPNVTWLGVRPYTDLPNYLACFDVATIPFKMNDITHATSPLKLFEYMAGRKPVVVTAMHESGRLEGVLTASTADEFSAQIDRALELQNNPDYIAMVDEVARENTWDVRAEQILQALSQQK